MGSQVWAMWPCNLFVFSEPTQACFHTCFSCQMTEGPSLCRVEHQRAQALARGSMTLLFLGSLLWFFCQDLPQHLHTFWSATFWFSRNRRMFWIKREKVNRSRSIGKSILFWAPHKANSFGDHLVISPKRTPDIQRGSLGTMLLSRW